MDAQVYFEESDDNYQFSKIRDDGEAFVIKKDDLIFETKAFYEYFFKGLAEKPQYTIVDLYKEEPDHKLTSEAKHVFNTVSQVLNKTCDNIEEKWFKEEDSQNADASNPNENDVPASND